MLGPAERGAIAIESTSVKAGRRTPPGRPGSAEWADGCQFAAYLAVATVLIVTPGPDTALIVRNALRSGRAAASFSALGTGIGSGVWAAASLLGVAVLLETSAVGFTLFKLLGAAYLGYLGLRTLWGTFRSRAASSSERRSSESRAVTAHRPLRGGTAVAQGLLNNLLNPKAGAIFVTVFPQFVARGDSPLRLVAMLLAYEVVLLAWLNLFGYFLGRAGAGPLGTRLRRPLDRLTGTVMIALGVRLALERR
jgi:threonine/homoserine/homoserine lactone efflux protein